MIPVIPVPENRVMPLYLGIKEGTVPLGISSKEIQCLAYPISNYRNVKNWRNDFVVWAPRSPLNGG